MTTTPDTIPAPDARPTSDRRLHPLSWLFVAGQAAKGFIIPALLVLFASSGDTYELWAAVFIVPLAARAFLHYAVFRYRLTDDELVVRDGILTRTERHIPYVRIQNIDLVQNPLHRMMRVALVRVETESGTRPEAVLRVLSLEAVDEMRAHVFAGRATAGAPSATARSDGEILLLRAGELVRLGIVSNKGLVVVSAALGVVWQRSTWLDPSRESALRDYLGTPPSWLTESGQTSAVSLALTIAGAILIAFVLLRFLSIGWFLVQLYGFRLSRHGNDLRAEYGLLTRVSRSIPPRRIQTFVITESPLHRWVGRQSVELRMVGGGGTDSESAAPTARSQWLAPIVATARVPALIGQVLPEVDLTSLPWQPIHSRAWRRIFARGLAATVALLTPLALMGGPAMLAAILPAGLLLSVHSRLSAAHTGYALTSWGIVTKSGWWNRTRKVVRYSKIQTVTWVESPFDRRTGMASVRIDTAGAERGGHTVDLRYLPADIATDVATRLYRESTQHAFRW